MENIKETEELLYNENVKTLDMADFLYSILRHWRILLILGIVFAALLGYRGIKPEVKEKTAEELAEERKIQRNYDKQLIDYENQVNSYEAKKRTYNTQMKLYEKALAEFEEKVEFNSAIQENYSKYMEYVNKEAEEKREYLDKSIYLNLDPKHTSKASMIFTVKLNDAEWSNYHEGLPDPVDRILTAYTNNTSSVIDWNKLGRDTGIDPEYVQELVALAPNLDSNTITLRAYYSDIPGAEKIINAYTSQLFEIWKDYSKELPGHEIIQIKDKSIVIYNKDIETKRKEAIDQLISFENQIASLKKNQDAYSVTATPEPPIDPGSPPLEPLMPDELQQETESGLRPKNAVKMGIIGMALGIILGGLIFAAMYVLDGFLHTGVELEKDYGLDVFADIQSDSMEEKNGIDRRIARIRGIRLSREECLKRCAILIKSSMENGRLLLTGTIPKEDIYSFAEELKDRIPETEIIAVESALVNSDTLEKIGQVKDVLILEKKNGSRHKDIAAELDCIRKQKGRIIGAVTI